MVDGMLKIEKTLFWKKKICLIAASLLVLSLVVLSCFLCYRQPGCARIVVLDKQVIFDHYYHDLMVLARRAKDDKSFKEVIDKKNAQFIQALSDDLSTYENKHHTMIIKRDTLLAPTADYVKRQDITALIVQQLKDQGALS